MIYSKRIYIQYNKERITKLLVTPFFVIRLGLEPKTPTLKVLCSTC